tara:strand:- start:15896 stop:19816 length:3921 start_codon:yes stop_codon:yes gene_type:complete
MLLLKNNFIFIDNIMGDILIDKIDEGIFKKYENIYNRNKEKVNKKEIDELQYGLNKFEINRMPDKNDPKFIYELTRQLQIYHCKSSFNIKDIQKKCNIDNFELSNNQQFLKNFINDETPYNGLLIFHGVGVGKTCSAINISSSFIDSKKDDKKIIALVSKNIQQNWLNTVYNPNKIGNQCSEDISTRIEDELKESNKKPSKYKVRRTIKEYYEFYGYLEFSNKLKRLRDIRIGNRELDKNEKELILKQVIREYCSDRIMIIDEVHNLREEKDSTEDENEDDKEKALKTKKERENARTILKKVVKYSQNMKLIIMSATPMFNKSKEIVWLMNLLLSNDKRPLLKYKDLFINENDEDILTDRGENLLNKKCSGYISYLRGENPISFPIRLYPNDKNSINRGKNNYPTINLFNESPITSYKFSFMDLYFNKMIDEGSQCFYYKEFIKSLAKKEEIPISERKVGIQLSNIVYSIDKKKINIKNVYGERGFNNFMDENVKKFSYKESSEPIFDINNGILESMSAKLTNILTGLKENKSKGIIFIYSDYIYSGVLPIALALEHIGFEKFGGKNILDYPEWKKNSENTKSEPIDFQWNVRENKTTDVFNRARYIILSGNKNLSPNNDMEIEAVKNASNSNGENIKIILGTSVTSEGLDFKNIREIHVLDPWYHLYKIEQIIGRGIRFCSHIDLPEKERNVTVFLHTSGISEEKESIDTNTYRMAEQKAGQIGKIETILKNKAIDCYLNEDINYISNMNKYKLISSRSTKIKKVDVNDQEYSKICSFSNKCKIECSIEQKDILTLDNININNEIENLSFDTYTEKNINELIKPVCKIIGEFYEIYNYYTLNELIDKVNSLMDTNIYIIYHSINHMINHKYPVWNINTTPGYIINLNDYYIFQPFKNIDKSLPLYERLITKENDHENIILNAYKDFEVDISGDSYMCFEDYSEIHYRIYTEIQKATVKGWRNPNNEIVYDEIIKLITKNKNNYGPFKAFKFSKGQTIKLDTVNNISEINLDYDLIRYLIPTINNDNYINHIIDKLKYSEKLTLLKNILSSVINNDYKLPEDKYDKYIYMFFKNNVIRLSDIGEYSILDENGGDIIGFFLHNTEKAFNNTLKTNINNFSFLIFDKETEQWIDLDEVGKLNIKKNFKPLELFKTPPLWGYSYKNKEEDHQFKIIRPLQRTSKDKLPGKVLADVLGFKSISLLEIFKENFPDYFKLYEGFILNLLDQSKDKVDKENKEKYRKIKDETKICSELYSIANKYFVRYNEYKKLINKEFLVLYGEFIMRDIDIKNNGNYYLSYDLFLLKFNL